MLYRKKPVVIEAFQFPQDWGKVTEEFKKMVLKETIGPTAEGGVRYYIKTLEGTMEVSYGDYIIKGIAGEFYSCKPDIFEQTYEPYYSQKPPRKFNLSEITDQELEGLPDE